MAEDTIRNMKLGTDGDISFSAGQLQMVSGGDSIVQAVKIALQFFKGEWFLDPNKGVPYFQEILGHKPTNNSLVTIFKNVILEVPGVLDVVSLILTPGRASRTMGVSFRISTDVGELEASTEI